MSVWCVRHKDGWCATKPNRKYRESAWCVPTRCGYYVHLPYGIAKREPTCPDCIKAAKENQ